MQLGLGLILSFLILLPGFSLYIAIFTRKFGRGFSPINPNVNSMLTVTIISIGSICGNLILAGIFTVQTIFCECSGRCLPVDFLPDLYAHVAGLNDQNLTAGSIFVILVADMLMFAIMFLFGRGLATWSATKDYIAKIRYGALAKLFADSDGEGKVLMARIITKIRYDANSMIAYEGILNDIVYKNSEFQSVHLKICTPFYINKQTNNVIITPLNVTGSVVTGKNMYFSRENMQNIEFFVSDLPTLEMSVSEILGKIEECRNAKLAKLAKLEKSAKLAKETNGLHEQLDGLHEQLDGLHEQLDIFFEGFKGDKSAITPAIKLLEVEKGKLKKLPAEKARLEKTIKKYAQNSDIKPGAPQPPPWHIRWRLLSLLAMSLA